MRFADRTQAPGARDPDLEIGHLERCDLEVAGARDIPFEAVALNLVDTDSARTCKACGAQLRNGDGNVGLAVPPVPPAEPAIMLVGPNPERVAFDLHDQLIDQILVALGLDVRIGAGANGDIERSGSLQLG